MSGVPKCRICPSCSNVAFPAKVGVNSWTCRTCGYGFNTENRVLDVFTKEVPTWAA